VALRLLITIVLCGGSFAVLAGGTPAAGTEAPTRHFQSPTGNINCTMATTWAHCLLRKNAWRRLAPQPRSCDTDWFPAEISVSRSGIHIGSCRGDVGGICVPRTDLACWTLRYGRSVSLGIVRCTSARIGITCRLRTGRRIGFRIAYEGYVLYR